MSNSNTPYGFRFVRNLQSSAPTYQRNAYQIASTNANSFGKGDVVKGLSSGYIDRALTSDTAFLGIFDGCEYYDTVLKAKQFVPAWLAPSSALAGSVVAYIIDDPYAVFGVQTSAANVTIGAQGNNINFGGNAAPNSNGQSVAYADQATIATTATLPFRIVNVPQTLGYSPVTAAPINNDSASAFNYIEVILNASAIKSTTGI